MREHDKQSFGLLMVEIFANNDLDVNLYLLRKALFELGLKVNNISKVLPTYKQIAPLPFVAVPQRLPN